MTPEYAVRKEQIVSKDRGFERAIARVRLLFNVQMVPSCDSHIGRPLESKVHASRPLTTHVEY